MTVTDMNAQNKTDFESKMQQHIQSFLMDNQKVEKWKKENTTPFIKLDPTENEDMLNKLVSELKHNFIIANMDEYKRTYFPEEFVASMVMTDTFICDNGGFESDFTYYKGYSSTFSSGSSTCNPINGGNPSVYVPTTLPTVREFEIVTTGTDAVTGLQKVKFGSKALKLNDVYHHSDAGCGGGRAINKIVKRFKVTEENRNFTVWYSIAMENPSAHSNNQPFFNINCDLAPLSELCFDSDILDCDSTYSQSGCGNNNLMDVLDWTCHRIRIPSNEIGNIATLEIIMGDCAVGGHNGYAYIDGICEPCSGSALGSVTIDDPCYNPCDTENAMICGKFAYPTVCGEWALDSLVFPEIGLEDLVVDTINGVFCFNLPISAFGEEDCISFSIDAYFSSQVLSLPMVSSNTVEICQEYYEDSNLDTLFSYLLQYDSICNGCFGDTLGSIQLFNEVVESGLGILYRSCDGDIATICGELNYPLLCNGWQLDSLVINGVEIENLFAPGYSGNFCFEVPFASFGEEDCLTFFAQAYFSLDTIHLPVLISDTIEICKEFYKGYEYNILVGDCHDNGTDEMLSDDYYFIKVTLDNVLGANWTMKRRLDYPYENEDGLYTLTSGSGDTIIFLGPFLVQEGGWDLVIELPGCTIIEHVTPPQCETTCVFGGYRIIGPECIDNDPSQDTWEFKLLVPGTSGGYLVDYPGVINLPGSFGSPLPITGLPLTTECITFTLKHNGLPEICTSKIVVCPPKPCGDGANCDLEVYVAEVFCDRFGQYSYSLDIVTSQNGKIICYETVDHADPTNTSHDNYNGPGTTPPSGPFDGDTQLIVRLCDGPTCSSCDDDCFKVIYIPQPDCPKWDGNKGELRTLSKSITNEVKIYPNPFGNNEFNIESTFDKTSFIIYSINGKFIKEGAFEGRNHVVSFDGESGLYILEYKNSQGLTGQIKITKLYIEVYILPPGFILIPGGFYLMLV